MLFCYYQQQNIPLQRLPLELKNITFDGVSLADLQNLRVSCPAMRDAVDQYQKHVVSHFITRTSSSRSHFSVTDDITIIGLGRTKVQTDTAIHDTITKHLSANLFISVEMGCPLSPYLLTHPNLQQVNISDFGTYPDVFSQMQLMYTQIFKESIPEEITAQRHALDAFAAVFPIKDVYFSKEKLEENIFLFLETLEPHMPIQETYHTLLTNTPIDQTSHIVISDAQTQDSQLKTKLQNLLATNPDHTVVLTVGNSANTVDAQGKLNNQIVNNFVRETKIKSLQLVNPRGNVKVIDNGFLITCDIVRFNIQGFKSLQSIGNLALLSSILTHVSFKDLPNLTWIGSHFMANCFHLAKCDFQGFTNVQHIDTTFLKTLRQFSENSKDKDLIIRTIQQINAKQKVGLADLKLTLQD